MADRKDCKIGLYANGKFQGYVKSISKTNRKVNSTYDKKDARTFRSEQSAFNAIEDIARITSGLLTCGLVD